MDANDISLTANQLSEKLNGTSGVTNGQRLLFGILALTLLAFLTRLIQRRQIDLRHGILWFPVALFVLLCSVFPQILSNFSNLLGFKLASNAVMSIAIMGLIFIGLIQSVALGRMKQDLRDLAQRMAILEGIRPPT